MESKHSQEMLSAYLDDELSVADRRQLEAHLSGCADCSAALEELEALRGRIGMEASRHAAPEYLKHRIHAALRAEPTHRPRRASPRAWPWAWINLGLTGAATAAFAVTLTLYLGQPSANERIEQELVASHFRALMPNHLADVASTDQHTVKPWFAGKLDFSPPVFDLAEQGYTLVGGRLDYLQQRPVAALAYRHRQHILNLYIWPDAGAHAGAPQASMRQGFHLLRWSQDGMQYSAVSDMNPQDLAQFAGQLRQKVAQADAQ
ncbi:MULTISPECIES: anti-sigma factor [unclassified Duganella]|uniref:anti-sigma factor family protein n=1 Tax=unclassified Duganella TaxID=2636909 RepID=UPI000E350E80|nr:MULTISPECIES: anti-sigma factor [unclassified Duganella]RFP13704.1 anti-sigma factor [Duganella sp. BJB475]RFP36412.1 anti-sigma factor [Duganella sp. BJB476]